MPVYRARPDGAAKGGVVVVQEGQLSDPADPTPGAGGRPSYLAAGRAMTRLASRRLAPPTGGQVCAMVAVDMAEFTRPDRDDDHRMFMREELYRILELAFDGSGIPWTACFPEDRGDGVLVVASPGNGATGIIDPLPERLRSLIRRHNHVSSAPARIQLRAAAQPDAANPGPGPGPGGRVGARVPRTVPLKIENGGTGRGPCGG
jgi:hypothetical protein